MANPFFNAKYYLEKNADVAAVVGDDADLAEQHYFLYGASEAADGTIVDRKPAPWFDIQFYANSREDLADVPAEQLFLHFVIHGMREGLSPMEGVEFDADTYLAANEDLVEALGIADPENLTADEAYTLQQHFFAHGYREGRDGGPEIPGYDPDQPDVDLDELTEALQDYQDAVAAKAAFLKAVIEDEDLSEQLALNEDSTDAEVIQAIEGAVEAAQSELRSADTAGASGAAKYGTAFEGASAEVTAAMIADVQATLAKRLDDATKAVAEVKGLKTALDAALSANDRYQQVAEDLADANTDWVAELGAFNGRHTGLNAAVIGPAGDDYAVGETVIQTGATPPVPLVVMGANGVLKLAADVSETTYQGITALMGARQDVIDLTALEVSRESALQKAIARVLDAQGAAEDPAYTKLTDAEIEAIDVEDYFSSTGVLDFHDSSDQGTYDLTITTNFLTAQNRAEAFDEAVEEYETASELAEALEAQDEAIEATLEAIDELGYHFVEFEDDLAVATEADDVFAYVAIEDEVTENTIDFFGEVGDDVLYVGTEFTYNDDIENGDASVLEIFFTQDGDDTIVTIEKTPFGTNAAEQEIDTITLTGVNAEDLAFVDGYVVFA